MPVANVALEVTNLDFEGIKTNLKNYLKSKDTFADFDFDHSNLSVLMDVMAYNSFYNAFYINQLANESFLESAQLRNNVVAKAKGIGYVPRSTTAPTATIRLQITPATPTAEALIVEEYTEFSAAVTGVDYFFVTTDTATVAQDRNGNYIVDIEVKEGTQVEHRYVVDKKNPDQRFLLKNTTADISTLDVVVQNSQTDLTVEEFKRADNLVELTGDSKVYFIDEVEDGLYEVTFGNGVLGKPIQDKNVVILDYIATQGDLGNGALTFVPTGKVAGSENVTVTTLVAANGGKPRESVEEIKFNAPKYFATQGRLVTTEDYLAMTRNLVPNLDSLTGWGGEDNVPRRYGEVFISVKPVNRAFYSELEKENIRRQLTERNLVTVRVRIVDPDYTFIEVVSDIYYDPRATKMTSDQLKQFIHDRIKNFSKTELLKFNRDFRYSMLVGLMDNMDPSVRNNLTSLRLRKSFIPSIVRENNFTLYYNNDLYRPNPTYSGTLTSSYFSHANPSGAEIADCQLDDNDGILRVVQFDAQTNVTSVVQANIGTVGYGGGNVVFQGFRPLSWTGDKVDVFCRPKIQDIKPLREQILAILDEDIKLEMTTIVDREGLDPTSNTATVTSSEAYTGDTT